MALLTIIQDPDPRLRQVSVAVEAITDEVRQLIVDMKETMLASKGAGLAAPQVGQLLRIFIVQRGERVVTFINPKIILRTGRQTDKEGCLSTGGFRLRKERAERVVVSAWNERGTEFKTDVSGFYARAIQHENDHLDGILLYDDDEDATASFLNGAVTKAITDAERGETPELWDRVEACEQALADFHASADYHSLPSLEGVIANRGVLSARNNAARLRNKT